MMTNERDLLVAAPERWDEACFAMPAVRAMMASGLGVGVLCRDAASAFWQTQPGLEVLPVPEKTKPKVAAAQIRGNWRAALAWEPGFAAEAFALAGIERRLGPDSGRKLRKHLTHPLACAEKPLEHRVRFYLSAAEEMGLATEQAGFFAPAPLGIDPVAGAVLLGPDSDYGPSHEWPLDRWQEIARKLLDGGRQVAVTGLPGGRNLGRTLAERLGGDVGFSLAEPLAGMLPMLATKALVITADGSLPHLAAFAGSTCVTLFGPNDPTWKRPLGRRHAVVQRHVECAPCLLAKCPLDMRCQSELETERVWKAVCETIPT
jgi:ADP-heptose:LPS heptosyltransferase